MSISATLRALRKLPSLLQEKRFKILAANLLLIAAIAYVDARMRVNSSLGFLYLFPMLVVGYYLSRWKIFVVAALCAVLRENFDPSAWQSEAFARTLMSMCAYFGAGLFVNELNRLQQVALEQSQLRQEAEEQLRALVESSPAAILTLDSDGKVLLANEAANRILGFADGQLAGKSVEPYLPVLTAVPRIRPGKRFFRSTIECTGRKQSGDIFLAQVWFSTYQTISGPRLAAIISDGSDELRDREGGGLHSVMNMSQILVRAALHEVRNLAAAASVAHANLERLPGARDSEDFKALGTLVTGLEKIASSELRPASDGAVGTVNLKTLFDELRIVIEPSFREAGIEIHWKISGGLPPVRADHQGLLQVFLNLAQNSRRAMRNVPIKRFTVSASIEDEWLRVRFQDTGHGVPVPDRLFQPLQPGAEATGLGLYVSRAIVRSFAGDLRHEQQALGTCFTVQLELARSAVAAEAAAAIA